MPTLIPGGGDTGIDISHFCFLSNHQLSSSVVTPRQSNKLPALSQTASPKTDSIGVNITNKGHHNNSFLHTALDLQNTLPNTPSISNYSSSCKTVNDDISTYTYDRVGANEGGLRTQWGSKWRNNERYHRVMHRDGVPSFATEHVEVSLPSIDKENIICSRGDVRSNRNIVEHDPSTIKKTHHSNLSYGPLCSSPIPVELMEKNLEVVKETTTHVHRTPYKGTNHTHVSNMTPRTVKVRSLDKLSVSATTAPVPLKSVRETAYSGRHLMGLKPLAKSHRDTQIYPVLKRYKPDISHDTPKEFYETTLDKARYCPSQTMDIERRSRKAKEVSLNKRPPLTSSPVPLSVMDDVSDDVCEGGMPTPLEKLYNCNQVNEDAKNNINTFLNRSCFQKAMPEKLWPSILTHHNNTNINKNNLPGNNSRHGHSPRSPKGQASDSSRALSSVSGEFGTFDRIETPSNSSNGRRKVTIIGEEVINSVFSCDTTHDRDEIRAAEDYKLRSIPAICLEQQGFFKEMEEMLVQASISLPPRFTYPYMHPLSDIAEIIPPYSLDKVFESSHNIEKDNCTVDGPAVGVDASNACRDILWDLQLCAHHPVVPKKSNTMDTKSLKKRKDLVNGTMHVTLRRSYGDGKNMAVTSSVCDGDRPSKATSVRNGPALRNVHGQQVFDNNILKSEGNDNRCIEGVWSRNVLEQLIAETEVINEKGPSNNKSSGKVQRHDNSRLTVNGSKYRSLEKNNDDGAVTLRSSYSRDHTPLQRAHDENCSSSTISVLTPHAIHTTQSNVSHVSRIPCNSDVRKVADEKANHDLHKRCPDLFSPVGDDTCVIKYPSFEFSTVRQPSLVQTDEEGQLEYNTNSAGFLSGNSTTRTSKKEMPSTEVSPVPSNIQPVGKEIEGQRVRKSQTSNIMSQRLYIKGELYDNVYDPSKDLCWEKVNDMPVLVTCASRNRAKTYLDKCEDVIFNPYNCERDNIEEQASILWNESLRRQREIVMSSQEGRDKFVFKRSLC